MINAALSTIPI